MYQRCFICVTFYWACYWSFPILFSMSPLFSCLLWGVNYQWPCFASLTSFCFFCSYDFSNISMQHRRPHDWREIQSRLECRAERRQNEYTWEIIKTTFSSVTFPCTFCSIFHFFDLWITSAGQSHVLELSRDERILNRYMCAAECYKNSGLTRTKAAASRCANRLNWNYD